MATCTECQGMGTLDGGFPACPACNGRRHNGMDTRIACQTCRGSGKASARERVTCWRCHGKGRIADSPKPAKSRPKPRVKHPSGGSSGSKEGGALDGVGKLLAIAAAMAAGVWAHRAMPDTPLAWFLFAGIAAAVAYALRTVIIVGGGIVAALAFFSGDRDADTSTGEAVTAASADPVTAQAEGTRVRGLCLSNLTGSDITVTVTTGPRATGDGLLLTIDEQRVFWRVVDDDRDRAYVNILPGGGRHRLATADVMTPAIPDGVTAGDFSCGPDGLADYEIRRDGDGYRITPA